MKFKRINIATVPEEVQAATGYVARVFATIESPPSDGLPISAELGNQAVEDVGVVQSFEPALSGYLKTQPQVGDELVIKIGSVAIPTGLTVENEPNA